MTDIANVQTPSRRRQLTAALLIVAAAIAMGLPTLRGTFVGADDHRLVLNHVLVNHPSLSHALELFHIVHRDLYQPLPLLSFSVEFLIADKLDLFKAGVASGAWLFHLTNVLLHAVNALLVWWVIRTMYAGRQRGEALAVATVGAVLFAVHPLQVEVVAWVNGRMMLLSTLFALASVAALGRWLGDREHRWAILTILFVTCSAMSKIRVGLPFLLLLVPLAQGRKLTRRFAVLWGACAVITALFAAVNFYATSEAGMFEGAVRNLHGPKIIRALMALAWYFEHLVWPVGLASWYPTPGLVKWSDPATIHALTIVAVALAVAVWTAWRWRELAIGFLWFALTIASTVQLVPTRNALAADRYMYLPITGLLWVASVGICGAYAYAVRRWRIAIVRAVVWPVVIVTVTAMIATSWHTARFYETPIQKGLRIAELFPRTPHVWERVAWAYHNQGEHDQAISLAKREFDHDDASAHCAAYQVIGMAQLGLGQQDDAVRSLHRAMEVNPESSSATYNLAKALEELGRLEEAASFYEQTIAEAPLANPRIIRLASLYRRMGRSHDARGQYEHALQNNPYDVKATMGLAELDLETGTAESYRSAEGRLILLLDWMPENADARVNLGVVYHALGRTEKAIQAYRTALAENPRHVTATFNLASLHYRAGNVAAAGRLFERAASIGFETIDQVLTVHDFLVGQDMAERTVGLWIDFLARYPSSLDARFFLTWSRALAGDLERVRHDIENLGDEESRHPLATAGLAYADIVEEHYEPATTHIERLSATGGPGADARDRLRRALGPIVLQRPDQPWPFCLAARLWIADGQGAQAGLFIDLCAQQCSDALCREYAIGLRARTLDATNAAPGRGDGS